MQTVIDGLRAVGIFLAFMAVRFLILLAVLALLTAVFMAGWALVRAIFYGRSRALGVVHVGGFHWRRNVAYSSAHAWLGASGQLMRVGIDDLAQRLLGPVTSVKVRPAGTVIRAGDPVVEVASGERMVVLPAPIDGTIAAVNPAVAGHPSILNQDPYSRGWIYALTGVGSMSPALRSGEQAQGWFAAEGIRLTHWFEGELGLAAADGGELIEPAPSLLPDERWRAAVRDFLDAGAR